MNVEMREELSRRPGIFRGDDIGLLKNAKRPKRGVLEVPDGGGYDGELSGHIPVRYHVPPPKEKDRRSAGQMSWFWVLVSSKILMAIRSMSPCCFPPSFRLISPIFRTILPAC